jgi:glutamine synthetase
MRSCLLPDIASLDQCGSIIVEYVWIGGSGLDMRSKCRTVLKDKVQSIADLEDWNFDGSSTQQASGFDSEIFLEPKCLINDPLRGGNNMIVLCDAYRPDGEPCHSNFRKESSALLQLASHERPTFAFEQEYILYKGSRPLGFPRKGLPAPQGQYYCSNGAENCIGREVMEMHHRVCLAAGLRISGTNAEVFPGQWEFQVGPCEGIRAADELWLARFLLIRVAELFKLSVSLDPKPILGDWNGSGNHCNYSTVSTMAEGGLATIETYISRLKDRHAEHILVYGSDNSKRLTGKHETASIHEFRSGVADRGASIRIPRVTARGARGYFEDRRPASNCDPYLVTGMMADTTIHDGRNSEGLLSHFRSWLSSRL